MIIYIMSYFQEPYGQNKNKIKVDLDLPNYTAKSDFKGTTKIGSYKFV